MTSYILAAMLLLQLQSANGTITGQILSVDGTPAVAVRVTAKTAADTAAGNTADERVSFVQTDS
ncbi:MAG TPA: hypothetical protein VFO86_10375, partial [Terriglobia bacterium]|nr:hypothetical protein [Terriglobia bacterium]